MLAAESDHTLPPRLSLAQVVRASDGRMVLLDRPFEPVAETVETFASDPDGLRSFFRLLACALATGAVTAVKDVDLARLQVGDHELLAQLHDPSREPVRALAAIRDEMSGDHREVGEISPRSRMLHVFVPLVFGVGVWFGAPDACLGMMEGGEEAQVGDSLTPPPRPTVFEWSKFVRDGGVVSSRGTRYPPRRFAAYCFLVTVASALVFRGGMALRLGALDVSTFSGRPAPWWRLVLRSLPMAVSAAAVGYTLFDGQVLLSATLLTSLVAIGLAVSFLSPTRGPGDLIACTFVRPR
jgi:hypothetical protein